MYNKVILVGNLTRDIEVRYTSSGMAIAKVGIATNRKFKSATGEMKDETMFIDVTFFGRTAEVANQYLKKGSKVLVEGRLILEQWVAQDGTKRSRHSVTVDTMQMLDSRGDNQNGGGYNNQQSGSYNGGNSGYDNGGYNNQQAPTQSAPQSQAPAQSTPQPNSNIPEIDIDEDEIPF